MKRGLLVSLFIVAASATKSANDEALFDLIRQSNGDDLIRPFRGGGDGVQKQREHRQLRTEYHGACHNPALLYVGTETSGRCICDEEYPTANRVLCIVEGVSCNNVVCTEEHDIWIFDKRSGDLSSRSTCVVCADEVPNCSLYDDTCFNAVFDENDSMTSCSVLLQDTSPVVSCSNCSPCKDQGVWGMEFNCFEGRWDTKGGCVTGSRVGHLPQFPRKGDPGYIETINTHRNGDYQRPEFQQSAEEKANHELFGPKFTTGAIISMAVVVGLTLGVLVSFFSKKRTRVPPAEDVIDFTHDDTFKHEIEKDSVQTPKIKNAESV